MARAWSGEPLASSTQWGATTPTTLHPCSAGAPTSDGARSPHQPPATNSKGRPARRAHAVGCAASPPPHLPSQDDHSYGMVCMVAASDQRAMSTRSIMLMARSARLQSNRYDNISYRIVRGSGKRRYARDRGRGQGRAACSPPPTAPVVAFSTPEPAEVRAPAVELNALVAPPSIPPSPPRSPRFPFFGEAVASSDADSSGASPISCIGFCTLNSCSTLSFCAFLGIVSFTWQRPRHKTPQLLARLQLWLDRHCGCWVDPQTPRVRMEYIPCHRAVQDCCSEPSEGSLSCATHAPHHTIHRLMAAREVAG